LALKPERAIKFRGILARLTWPAMMGGPRRIGIKA